MKRLNVREFAFFNSKISFNSLCEKRFCNTEMICMLESFFVAIFGRNDANKKIYIKICRKNCSNMVRCVMIIRLIHLEERIQEEK